MHERRGLTAVSVVANWVTQAGARSWGIHARRACIDFAIADIELESTGVIR